ncbi:MAG: papain-like cysteine protease family protein [Chitinophagales bacterium]
MRKVLQFWCFFSLSLCFHPLNAQNSSLIELLEELEEKLLELQEEQSYDNNYYDTDYYNTEPEQDNNYNSNESALKYVGIPSEKLNYIASAQENSQWCWAASIQMIFNYYGVDITQSQIVSRTYGTDYWGNLPDWPASFQTIHANLNNWSIDNNGQYYEVSAEMGMGTPTPAFLVEELSNNRPVIIGYNTGQGGHAVIVTAISYYPTAYGPQVQTIIVRDPWPSYSNLQSLGRIEYDALSLATNTQAYWSVRIKR